jgi:pyruvate carboxylase subunit B
MNDEDPAKGLAPARKQLQEHQLPETDENLFIVAACKEKGLAFLLGQAELGIRKVDPHAGSQPGAANAAAATGQPGQPAQYSLTVNGQDYFLAFQGNNVTVDGNVYQVAISNRSAADSASDSTSDHATGAATGSATEVTAQMPGVVLRIVAQPGDQVKSGDTLLVLEAMKMEVSVAAPCSGTVREVLVSAGQQVANGEKLAAVG